jgi:hypothetical protein
MLFFAMGHSCWRERKVKKFRSFPGEAHSIRVTVFYFETDATFGTAFQGKVGRNRGVKIQLQGKRITSLEAQLKQEPMLFSAMGAHVV